MRVTFTSVNRNVQKHLSGQYSTMANLQEQLATGKRLQKPSDAPVDVANAIKLRTKSKQLEQYKRNIDDGLAVMGVASSAMQSMNELLHRARELAVQAANDTNTDIDRTYIQQEVDQIYRQMMSVVNTQFKGNYIFNGTNTKTPPYIIASSESKITNYYDRSMATYGEEMVVNIRSTANPDPLLHNNTVDDTIFIDKSSYSLDVGDRLQLKWNSAIDHPDVENQNVGNIMNQQPDNTVVPPLAPPPFETLTINGNVFDIRKDFDIDYMNGQVIILSESLRDELNHTDNLLLRGQAMWSSANHSSGTGAGPDFNFSLTDTFQVSEGKHGHAISQIFPGSFTIKMGEKTYVEGSGFEPPKYTPGYYDDKDVWHEGKYAYDYSVDYETGKITVYNPDLLRDMRPEWLVQNDHRLPNTPENPYNLGQLSITFDYITHGKNIYGEPLASYGDILRAVEEGITIPINMRADEMLLDLRNGNDMVGTFLRYSQALLKDDRAGIQNALDELNSMYDVVLNAQSEAGATIYRMELTQERNGVQQVEVLQQRSYLEDADLAEVISKLMLAETIYNASLQAAMRVLQPSLANYM